VLAAPSTAVVAPVLDFDFPISSNTSNPIETTHTAPATSLDALDSFFTVAPEAAPADAAPAEPSILDAFASSVSLVSTETKAPALDFADFALSQPTPATSETPADAFKSFDIDIKAQGSAIEPVESHSTPPVADVASISYVIFLIILHFLIFLSNLTLLLLQDHRNYGARLCRRF
jgi:hypothetical protein